jgi:hypothetical protein
MKPAFLTVPLMLGLLACAPSATPAPFTGEPQHLAISSLVSPFSRGTLERIVTEEIEATPALRARVSVIPQAELERALGGVPPQNWSAANFAQLESSLNATLFLSGRVALSASTRQAVLRLSNPRGLIGDYVGETTSLLVYYRVPPQAEDAREVIRQALEHLIAGLSAP